MRPVRLVAEGFSAFRERVELDFDGIDFFALVGPTGAGKSSVIDAVCFALYGCVPRYEDRRVVAPAITVGALEAKVALEFALGGRRYVATRVVRRTRNGATTREARLELLDPPGAGGQPGPVLAGNADELTAAIGRLLGLSFEQFTRCVVLPQGEFARFLHDKPSDRQQLLTDLLGFEVYARVGRRARELAAGERNGAEVRQRRLDDLAFATADALASAGARAGELEALGGRLRTAEEELAGLEDELRAERSAGEVAASLLDALAGVVLPAAVEQEGAALARFDTAVAGATAALALAESARSALEQAGAALPDRSRLEAALAAHVDLAEAEGQLAAATGRLEAAQQAASAADAARAAAEARREQAADGLEQLRRRHGAADLARELRAGEPCPVCRQVVRRLPDLEPPAQLAGAEALRRLAADAAGSASAAAQLATGELARAEAAGAELMTRCERAAKATAGHPDRPAVEELLRAVTRHGSELAAARAAEQAARGDQRGALDAAEGARRAFVAARAAFNAQRDAVVALTPPLPGGEDLLGDWRELAGWATAQLPDRSRAAAEAAERVEALAARREHLLDSLRSACTSAGVEVAAGAPSGDLRAAVAAAGAAAAAQLDAIAGGIAEAGRLRGEVAEALERAGVAELLGRQLQSQGFERWLVAEALELLVVGASETLRQLSGGQYSLARDDKSEFLVVDHRNADERRPARTLSGGETFQASLALALALSDQLAMLAAGGSARLESIFLDEGFGSLDPEALAVVADTIEALGSDDRLVGIVTHVRELAERVPVRFEVTKNARTSTVERRTG